MSLVLLLGIMVLGAGAANASVIQLGFILDRSGSIGTANWNIIKNGLATALVNNVPVTGTYEISVVSFANGASVDVNKVLISNAGDLATVAALINGIVFTGGGTDMAAGFSLMQSTLFPGTPGRTYTSSYVNLATDGVPNSTAAATAARDALIAAGADNISIEAIGGGVNASYLQNSICYPGPCDTTSPFDFPNKGFYLGIDSVDDYAAAITAKVRIVTGQEPNVPEPSTYLMLSSGLLLAGLLRRKK